MACRTSDPVKIIFVSLIVCVFIRLHALVTLYSLTGDSVRKVLDLDSHNASYSGYVSKTLSSNHPGQGCEPVGNI